MKKYKKIRTAIVAVAILTQVNISNACTDIMLNYSNDYVVGRNFDWPVKNAFFVVNPIGLQHQSSGLIVKQKPLTWTSKYGSITIELATPNKTPNPYAVLDGINQYGLTGAQLWLQDSEYPTTPGKNIVATGLWVQYLLDNAKTVPEAVQLAKNMSIEPVLYDGQKVLIHVIIHDAQGNSAVLEYLQGKLVVHQGKNFPVPVLTNNNYADSVASLQQYQGFGGDLPLPNAYDSQARFVRAANFIKQLPPIESQQQAIANAFDALSLVSEPVNTPYTTVWSVVYDLSSQIIYYRDIDNPNIRSVNLKQFNFAKGASVEILLINNKLKGNVAAQFQPMPK